MAEKWEEEDDKCSATTESTPEVRPLRGVLSREETELLFEVCDAAECLTLRCVCRAAAEATVPLSACSRRVSRPVNIPIAAFATSDPLRLQRCLCVVAATADVRALSEITPFLLPLFEAAALSNGRTADFCVEALHAATNCAFSRQTSDAAALALRRGLIVGGLAFRLSTVLAWPAAVALSAAARRRCIQLALLTVDGIFSSRAADDAVDGLRLLEAVLPDVLLGDDAAMRLVESLVLKASADERRRIVDSLVVKADDPPLPEKKKTHDLLAVLAVAARSSSAESALRVLACLAADATFLDRHFPRRPPKQNDVVFAVVRALQRAPFPQKRRAVRLLCVLAHLGIDEFGGFLNEKPFAQALAPAVGAVLDVLESGDVEHRLCALNVLLFVAHNHSLHHPRLEDLLHHVAQHALHAIEQASSSSSVVVVRSSSCGLLPPVGGGGGGHEEEQRHVSRLRTVAYRAQSLSQLIAL